MKRKHIFIFGTRPEILKFHSIWKEMQKRKMDFILLNTNQHYDKNMLFNFFEELKMPKIKYQLTGNFELSQARFEIRKILNKENPRFCWVQGDTDSALAGTLASHDLFIPVMHRESGVRSLDSRMHEEKNRIMIDKLATIHFAPTIEAVKNLKNEKIQNIFLVGNTLVDLIDMYRNRLKKKKSSPYIYFTFHRKENLESYIIKKVMYNLNRYALLNDLEIIMPVHPHTKKVFMRIGGIDSLNIKFIEPLGYVDNLNMIWNAEIVITDSGGISEEAGILKKKCITLRRTTDRPELCKIGANFLIDPESEEWEKPKFKGNWSHPYSHNVARQICDILQELK